ncbi:HAD family hydrolase [Streptomyces sclerotialus]|uniref:HAD family hydrolase n=1 Tax=Streptomyces sclerotialus TaxID=1957 RepID=UPI00068FEE06
MSTHQRERSTYAGTWEPAHVPATLGHSRLLQCRALLLGIEGLVTDTARLHAGAWKRTLDGFLRDNGHVHRLSVRPFDPETDFRRFFQGRARLDGLQAFLTSRGIYDPGHPDSPGVLRALVADEDRFFDEQVRRHGVPVWPDSLDLVAATHAHAMPVVAVSASRHGRRLLRTAGLAERFDAIVDGCDRTQLHVPAGPDPALLIEAARHLRTAPEHSAVVVAAPAWITAARRGGFALPLGVNREGRTENAVELYERGAAQVTRSLAELVPRLIPTRCPAARPGNRASRDA